MDPNATLRELRDYADQYAEGCLECAGEDCAHGQDLARISELITCLGGWLAHSGYRHA
jgi:hypothetical protein